MFGILGLDHRYTISRSRGLERKNRGDYVGERLRQEELK